MCAAPQPPHVCFDFGSPKCSPQNVMVAAGSGAQTAEDKTRGCERKGRQEPLGRRPARGQASRRPAHCLSPRERGLGSPGRAGSTATSGVTEDSRGCKGPTGTNSPGSEPWSGPGQTVGSRVSAGRDPGPHLWPRGPSRATLAAPHRPPRPPASRLHTYKEGVISLPQCSSI